MSSNTAPDIELVADWLSGGDVDPSVVLWGADLDRYRDFLVGREAPSLRGCTLIQCRTEDPGLVAKIASERPNRIDIAHLQQRPTEPAPSYNGRDYLVVTGDKLDDAVEILRQRGTHAGLRRGRAAEAAGAADALRARAARAGLHLGPGSHRSVQASVRPGDRGPRAAR